MIDKNKLFSLFGNTDENKGEILVQADSELLETPFIKIGMFTKLIVNHWVFHEKLKQFLSKEQPDYNVEETKAASEFTVFNRAWHYIKTVNIEKRTHLHALTKYNPKVLANSLDRTISFFENLEAYEKCAHMHNILKIVKKI